MDVVTVGAGPAGLFSSIALARRGHRVRLLDRDAGPPAHGRWNRKGVMQFHQAHTFRAPVIDALRSELPDVLTALLDAGAVVAAAPDGQPAALLCRRSTFDAVLRAAATAQPGVSLHTAHVDGLVRDGGRVMGVRVQGRTLTADLVLDASGRASRITDGVRPPAEGGECGVVYVTRQYRRHGEPASAEGPPTNSPIGLSLGFERYFAIAFLHDDHTFSITIAHGGRDARLKALRHADVFEAAVASIPGLVDWIDPRISHPTSDVLPGGRLYNGYRGQADRAGRLCTPGMISVGDAVATTTPLAGRGVTLALMQATALLDAVVEHGADTDSAARQFDDWCDTRVKPWFDDHRYADADRLRRWTGGDVDVTRRLPSDLIVATAGADERLRAAVAPYARMDALPDSLDPVEPVARAMYARGWRAPVPDGPTVEELSRVVSNSRAVA